MTPRRRVLNLLIVLLIMVDQWRRISLGHYTGYEISMWVMEFLILVLVGYEVWDTVWTRITNRRRGRQLRERSEQVFMCIDKGQDLLLDAPSSGADHNKAIKDALDWSKRVADWDSNTLQVLSDFPEVASTSFADNSAVELASPPEIVRQAHRHYSLLKQRLKVLHAIVEKPERYL